MNKIERKNRFRFMSMNPDTQEQVPIIAYQLTMSQGEKFYNMVDFRRAFQELGLDEHYIGEVTKEGICSRAINETVRQLRNHEFVSKKVGDETSDVIVYKIYKQIAHKSNGKLDASMEAYAHITYRKSNGTIECDNNEVEHMLTQNYRTFLTNYVTGDVSRYIRTMLARESSLISLRKQGGVYVIPAKDHDLLDKLQRLFDKVDPSGDFNVIELPDLAGAKTAIAKGFQRGIKDVVEDIKDRLKKMEEDDKQMSPTIRKNLFEEIVVLQKELELMKDITEFDLLECSDAIGEAQIKIAEYSL